MRSPSTGDLAGEECGACGARWLEGEALFKALAGGVASDALLQQAKGKPGQCKGCASELRYVPGCPSCGRQAPTCPRCGDAPLPVVDVRGVKVDLCVKCQGAGLDAAALARLLPEAVRAPEATPAPEAPPAPEAVEARALLGMDLRPKVRLGDVPVCTACQRKVKPRYGFVWEERLYCGSCAPQGSTPYTDELTKARPSEEPDLVHYFGETGRPLSRAYGGSAIAWLLSKILG